MKTLRHVVVAFRAACHMHDAKNSTKSEYEEEQLSKKKKKRLSKDKSELGMYKVENSAVYNAIVSVALKHGVSALLHHLGAPNTPSQLPQQQQQQLNGDSSSSTTRAKLVSQNKNWGKLKVVTKSFVSNALHLLRSLTDSSLTSFVLQNLERSILLFAPFPKICRALLKVSVFVYLLACFV